MQQENLTVNTSMSLLADVPDLTSTDLWEKTKAWFLRLYEPSFGKVSSVEHLNASPDGTKIAFTASTWRSLDDGSPRKSICLIDITKSDNSPQFRQITQDLNDSMLPKWSPDGKTLAFISDRLRKGHSLLYAIETEHFGEARLVTSPTINGIVRDFEWSADGSSLLIYVAPFGLPMSGVEGSGFLADNQKNLSASWMPKVSSDKPSSGLCSLWLYDIASGKFRQVSNPAKNVWSFCWAGRDHAYLKVSESAIGYSHQAALLVKLSLSSGDEEIIRVNNDQMVGRFVSAPSGEQVVVVESAGGERVKIVGKLALIDTTTGSKTLLPTKEVDVGWIEFVGPGKLFAMGLRNMHSVALEINTSSLQVRELWATSDTCGGLNGFAQGCVVPGRGFAMVRSNWTLPPEIGLVDTESQYHRIFSSDHDGAQWLRSQLGRRQFVAWHAPDGLEVHGILYPPATGAAPYRTVLFVHGGPFSAVTDKWLGYTTLAAWLVAHGYAVLCPNPRGSVGRGASYTEAVKGDIGGGDAQDLLAGLDHVIQLGLADPDRLAVIGGSYGGYMSSWLVTQTQRFSAAVAISPVCDYKIQWICGDERMPILGDAIYTKDSLAERRSPLAHVQHCKTPTLLLAGSKDHCTPPQHAQYFHLALLDQGAKSVLAEYPREGHGVRLFPEIFDAYSRVLDWFDMFV